MPIYNITVHGNKIYVALKVAKVVGAIIHQHATRVSIYGIKVSTLSKLMKEDFDEFRFFKLYL